MPYKLVREDADIDIGKLLGGKIKSFTIIDDTPGEFTQQGKKLIYSTPEVGIGDDHQASVEVTYVTKKGKTVTTELDLIVGDSDGTNASILGGDDPNSLLLNTASTKKHWLIYGLGDNDTIEAGNGNDTIYGGDGDDEITSYGGNDKVAGEGGNDTINTGLGTNIVDGGSGDDLIFLRGSGDTATGGDGIDSFGIYDLAGTFTITDFTAAVDKLYYEESRFQEASFAAIATKTATGTLLTFDADTKVLLEGFFL
jgi:Ca2+-binding RTX toxin-like protein